MANRVYEAPISAGREFRIEVRRDGRAEPLIETAPTLTSAQIGWAGIAVETHRISAGVIPRHEHPEHFLQVVLEGCVKYEVQAGGRRTRFVGTPGTVILQPRGAVDEIRWLGLVHTVAVAIHPTLLTQSLETTAHRDDIELRESFDLKDRHIASILNTMTLDLAEGSPAGRLYGESLADSLAVYLASRHSAGNSATVFASGGLPAYRLKRVMEFIGENMGDDLSLGQLATIAGMSPHYFSEMFRQSTGHSPYQYVLLQRIERAKQRLRTQDCSVTTAGVEAGFANPSHFARTFRRIVGTSPSKFQEEATS
jgi:AraC family transcriptional regulator